MTDRVRRLYVIAAAVWIAFAALVITVGPFSANSIENRLQRNAQMALQDRGLDWVQVEMRGQRAVLTGAAPSDDARADAMAVALASTWSGGVVAGGTTGVVDDMTNARLERSFAFRADMAVRGRVLIRGDATDAAARDGIARYAASSFASGADTDLTLVPGGGQSAEWEEAAKRLLGQLARLERGSIYLEGQQAALVGEAGNPQVAATAVAALANLPAPYRAASVITPSGAPAETFVPDEAACRAVVRAAHGSDALRFDREAATPSPLTDVALRRVARMFAACPETMRLVIGIAVAEGGDTLAADRLEAVRTRMMENGVSEARLALALANNAARMMTFEIEAIEG